MGKKMKRKRIGFALCILLCSLLPLAAPAPAAVLSEGVSADMTMTFSRSVLNIGKTFTVTVSVKPNAPIEINSFDFSLGFDASKVEIVKDGDLPKTARPSNVPATFDYGVSIYGDSVVAMCSDNTSSQNAPIKAGTSTPIIAFYFKVKDTAAEGSAAGFTILEPTVNQLMAGGDPTPVSLTVKSPKTGTIGPKLDTNTRLSALTPDTGTLSPAFDKTVQEYTLDVPEDCDTVRFTAPAESSSSAVKITGGEGLDYGPNTVTIRVTAEDPDYVRNYTVTVNRAVPPTPTLTAEPTATPEPTEPPSSPEASSAAPSVSEGPESTGGSGDGGMWKNLAILFAFLFFITAIAAIWLAVDKVRNRGRMIRVKRV